MRRLTIVAHPGLLEDEPLRAGAMTWLDSLPLAGIDRVERLDQATLDRTDVLWVRDDGAAVPALRPWLEAGGRLLATHTGARLPAALGLESHPPTVLSPAVAWSSDFGLAGFGAHPLFVGLRDGGLVGPPVSRQPVCGYPDGRRPVVGGVVALARQGLLIDPETVLAWELAVGSGGVLCLAFEPALAPGNGPADGEVMLANALVGEAIPHRDRAVPVVVWPEPGRMATARVTGTVSPTAPADPWPPSAQPRLDLTPAADWVHAGRRCLVAAEPTTGRRDVWVFPFRIMHGAAVRHAIACAPGHLAPDEVAGGLAVGDHRLLERWVVAADVPAAVWELGGPDGVPIEAEWAVDLRRAWPHGPGAFGDLRFEVAAGGGALRVDAAGGPAAVFAVRGGRLEAVGSDERAEVRVVCHGSSPLRIAALGAMDRAELDRAGQVLARDGVGGLSAARARQADQLERYGTAFESPDELLAQGFAWARQRGAEAVVGVPGIGRSVLTACPRHGGEPAWCFGTGAVPAAVALLVAGHRDPARELVRFLAQAQHPSGGIPVHHPVGGLASGPEVGGTVAFLDLAARLLAWTGDEDAIRSLVPSLRRALGYLEREGVAPPSRVLDALDGLMDRELTALVAGHRPRATAEPVGQPAEAHAIVQAAAAALRRAPGALEGGGAAPALLEAVARLWGLEPDAVEGTLSIRPALPPDWARFALRRLRVGRTLLDLEVRRRPAVAVVRAVHRFGPSLVLTVALRGHDVMAIELDDEPMAAGRARFELRGRHEVRFQLR